MFLLKKPDRAFFGAVFPGGIFWLIAHPEYTRFYRSQEHPTRQNLFMNILTATESNTLADLLFPDVHETRETLEHRFPSRNGKIVTRFAPSPTGFMHIGGLYSALVSERFAHLHDGVFMLRIEDTDQKREIENGVQGICSGLLKFELKIDEGPSLPETGAYGPYLQSARKSIYHVYAKEMVAKNIAYPCFLTEAEIAEIRELQSSIGKVPGIYGEYSTWASESFENIQKQLANNEPYVLRYRCTKDMNARVQVSDEIRREIEMQDNFHDIVLLKTNGIPTYHFAHVVDDYLMRTTHVIRSDEWLPSLPLHTQLFAALELPTPKYVHFSPLLKQEDGGKRKLSKRKDPEANVAFFFEE